MFIARIKLKNFKSFGGSHDLPLSPGFTAIVGPNGSGKSNILDGLRWGLGDSNGSRLRITRQSDLLFQGTAIQKPAKAAEVLLEFSDGEGKTSVKRKFSEDAGALTYVDGIKCRIQDLQETKHRYHLDGDRFAFIGQGDVTDAISQRPMERRNQLEELFGINIYRKKRDEALSKVSSAEQELARLYSLVAELETRRRQIASAVEIARKAVALEKDLSETRGRWYHLRRRALEENLEELKRKVSYSRRDSQNRLSWKIVWEQNLSKVKSGAKEIELRKSVSKQELAEAEKELEDLRRRVFEIETSLRLEEERLGTTEESARSLSSTVEDLEKKVKKYSTEDKDISSQVSKIAGEIEALETRHRALLEEKEAKEQDRLECLQRQGEIKSYLERARATEKALGSTESERLPLIEKMDNDLKVAEAEIGKINLEEVKIQKMLNQATKERKDADDKCKALGTRLQPLRKEIYRKESEIDRLNSSSSEEGYPRPVVHLLAAADLGKLTFRPTPVVEAFQCPGNLAVAVEAALGGRQFWLLAQSLSDAQDGIEELKRAKAGRTTYLTLDRARPRRPKDGVVLPDKGVVGWAIDLVSVQDIWRPALEHLIGDLLIVESYGVGASLVAGGYSMPIVTLEGEVFSPGGTVSGGGNRRPGGVIQARAQQRELDESLKTLKKELLSLESSLKKWEQEEASKATAVQALSLDLQRVQAQKAHWERSLSDSERDKKFFLAENKAIEGKKESLLKEIKSHEEALAKEEERLLSISIPEDVEIDALLSSLRPDLVIWNERAKGSIERLEGATKDLEKAKNDFSSCTVNLLNLKNRRDSQCEALKKLNDQVTIAEEVKKIKLSELAEAEKGNSKIEKSLDICSRRFALACDRLDEGEKTVAWIEQKLEREKSRLDDIISSWESKYPYPGPSLDYPRSSEEEERRLKHLESSLAQIGDFDRGAISEDSSLSERIGYYGEQTQDVSSGIDELRALVEETDRQAGSLFGDALDKIDLRFNGLFQRLFGGGEAHLKIQGEGGLWDSGVEIIARPPGKVSAYLAQLSGGEQTLTALSLLFASMEVAQVPLAVLDEVDAALDEVNLGRFADIVADYSSSLQIIAMTHRRQTMERADVMYGVTMSEPGLSQVVGVKLEDWK
nr:chromosome segregation protein SMC [uncultured Dethiosulfovibrio sp.]